MRAKHRRNIAPWIETETVIKPNPSFFIIPWREVVEFRYLIWLLAKKDLVTKYTQTILGPLWNIVQPLMMSWTLIIVFEKLSRVSTGTVPTMLFYLSGLVIWGYCSSIFSHTAEAIHSSVFIFRRVYFPRSVIPLSIVLSKLVSFFIQLSVFLFFFIYFKFFTPEGDLLNPNLIKIVFFIPVCLTISALIGLGFGLCLSAFSLKYRDFNHLLPLITQIWFYGSAIIFPISNIPRNYHWLTTFNPIIPAIDMFRWAFFGTYELGPFLWSSSFIFSFLVALFGLLLFNACERRFIDMI